ncbi:MAG TPA: pilus assembly protein N-terminal domain-containing protein [Bradyrhizobium sp.]|jgi:Flp pilus assembly secretin CpaC|nr:pilus assembly protein N-terminal domain-containing protein [Bradyrhizobium sp.]
MKPNIPALVLAATLLFSATSGARAEDDAVALGIGTAFRISLQKAFETVIVGDPLIVDVRTDDNQSVVIEPLKAGVTNLVFVDAHGMVTANVKVSVCGASSSPACATSHSSL